MNTHPQRRTLVELVVLVGAVLIDVVQKDLREFFSFETVSPMLALDSAIEEGIARIQFHGLRPLGPRDPKRPGCLEFRSQVDADADFARRSIAVMT